MVIHWGVARHAVSKLFKLKKWVTIPDAARHLSQIVNEPVSEADVLQMALDGHIKLSVDFPNCAKARIGRVIPYKEVPHRQLPSLDGKSTLTYADGYILHDLKDGEQINDETPFIHFDKEIVSIDGIWDLAMLGNERFDIANDLQNMIGGPEVTMINIDGTFLNRPDGSWAALQNKFEDKTVTDLNGQMKTVRGSYYPAGGLGTDCTRVIRTSEILELQSSLASFDFDKPLGNRERDTLLTIIAVLCKEAKLEYAKAAKTAGLIQSTAAGMGLSIGETTIEVHLKKIPNAIATRMK